MRRMVIAPHADDEVGGAGGYLAKYPDTQVLVVAGPDAQREVEFLRAMDVLGVFNYALCQFDDGNVGGNPLALTGALDAWLRDWRPDELLIPAPGTHQDHVAVYEASMRAARLSMNARHHSPPVVLVYDVPAYDLELYPTNLRWNVFEELRPEHVQRKAAAMACYESQIPSAEHPASNGSVSAAARMVGSEVGVMFAEKYSAVRMVRR